ncbi:MAG: hypothetical protein ACJ77A_05135 [Actinomycetota bacterium]
MLPGFRTALPTGARPTGLRASLRSAALVGCVVFLVACSADRPRTAPSTQSSPTKQSLIGGGGVTRPTAAPSGDLPACKFPARIATPDWLPTDLPFPAGVYTYQDLSDSDGYHRALMVIPSDLTTWTKFVLEEWPKAGYVLGRGDAEPGEVEDQFLKAPTVGAFKAVSVYCSPGFSRMLLVFAEQSPGLPVLPSASGSAVNPTASP